MFIVVTFYFIRDYRIINLLFEFKYIPVGIFSIETLLAIYLTLHRTLYTLEILSPWSLSIYWREICGNSICLDTWTWIEITQVFALFLSRRKNRMEEIINEKEYYAVWCWAHFVVILWPIICLQQNVECKRTKSHEIFDFCQRYIITHKTLFFCQANSLV